MLSCLFFHMTLNVNFWRPWIITHTNENQWMHQYIVVLSIGYIDYMENTSVCDDITSTQFIHIWKIRRSDSALDVCVSEQKCIGVTILIYTFSVSKNIFYTVCVANMIYSYVLVFVCLDKWNWIDTFDNLKSE